jgi:hypothetical protein
VQPPLDRTRTCGGRRSSTATHADGYVPCVRAAGGHKDGDLNHRPVARQGSVLTPARGLPRRRATARGHNTSKAFHAVDGANLQWMGVRDAPICC